MSPKRIHSNAVITGPHALYPQYFEILPTTGGYYQQALQIPLVVPNILTFTDSVIVTLTVAMDVSYASSNDHDLMIGVSDGISFIGYIAHDRAASPCDYIEGGSNTNTLQNPNHIYGSTVTSRRYSSEIKIQIISTEKWGSCHTEHDEGHTYIAHYQRLVDLSKGLLIAL